MDASEQQYRSGIFSFLSVGLCGIKGSRVTCERCLKHTPPSTDPPAPIAGISKAAGHVFPLTAGPCPSPGRREPLLGTGTVAHWLVTAVSLQLGGDVLGSVIDKSQLEIQVPDNLITETLSSNP